MNDVVIWFRVLCTSIAFFVLNYSAVHAQGVKQDMFCRLLPAYRQAPGVEFQPGIDVEGKPVAPADLSASEMTEFETMEIPVEIDLIQKFGLNVPPGTELKPYAALISIHKNGKVDYNGQDISPQAEKLCGERNSEKKTEENKGKKDHE